jgi:hypothetical protein
MNQLQVHAPQPWWLLEERIVIRDDGPFIPYDDLQLEVMGFKKCYVELEVLCPKKNPDFARALKAWQEEIKEEEVDNVVVEEAEERKSG